MATSFITKDTIHGFWINDSLMQVVCWALVNTINETCIEKGIWPNSEFKEHLFNNSQGIFVGFMHLSLDEFIITDEQKEKFIEIIKATKTKILLKGSLISPEELNAFQMVSDTRRIWIEGLDTSRVVKALDFLEDVVSDKNTILSSDKIDYEL